MLYKLHFDNFLLNEDDDDDDEKLLIVTRHIADELEE